jgi:hypothetical protein
MRLDREYLTFNMLPHNRSASAEGMKEVLVAFSDAQNSSVTMTKYAQALDGTMEWNEPWHTLRGADAEVPILLVNGKRLVERGGVNASIYIKSSQFFLLKSRGYMLFPRMQ